MSTTVIDTAFTAADRCDRCGARAAVRVILLHGELLLCAHHGREHEAALRDQALRVESAPEPSE